jgi:aminomethyltransferase
VLATGVAPAGLGARDTLRLEAGLPLHGHELGPGITPLQAGLAWVVGWDKPSFTGRAALEEERAAGPARRLRGLVGEGRQPLRDGSDICVAGERVGVLTSGNFSPMRECGIGLGLVEADAQLLEGDAVTVVQRGRELEATLVRPPLWPVREEETE